MSFLMWVVNQIHPANPEYQEKGQFSMNFNSGPSIFTLVFLWCAIVALNLALLGGAVWLVVVILRAMGVIPPA